MSDKTLERINNILTFAINNAHSDFYREKYLAHLADLKEGIRLLEDVKKIPFLTKKELLDASSEQLLFVEESDVKLVSSTSGTTGKPLVIRFSELTPTYDQLDNLGEGAVLVLFPPILGAYLYNRFSSLHQRGPTILGDIHNLPATCALAAQVNTVMLATTPTLAVLLKKYLEQYPTLEASIKYLRMGSEFFTASKKQYLQRLYPNTTIYANYSSTEGQRVAYQCEHLAKASGDNYFHIHTFADGEPVLHLEVVDIETSNHVREGETGELVMTNLYNKAMPLIRYKTGDLVSLHQNNCPCGAPQPLLRCLGRANHDTVRAAGFELRRDMFEPAILSCGVLDPSFFEVHVFEEIEHNQLQLRLEFKLVLTDNIQPNTATETSLIKHICEKTRISSNFTLADAVEKKLVRMVSMSFVDKPHSHKTHAKIFLH